MRAKIRKYGPASLKRLQKLKALSSAKDKKCFVLKTFVTKQH